MGHVPAQLTRLGRCSSMLAGAWSATATAVPARWSSSTVMTWWSPAPFHPGIRTLHGCPRCLTHSEAAGLPGHMCAGQRIEHDDGTADCTAGDACLGERAVYVASRSCRMLDPARATASPHRDYRLTPSLARPPLASLIAASAPAAQLSMPAVIGVLVRNRAGLSRRLSRRPAARPGQRQTGPAAGRRGVQPGAAANPIAPDSSSACPVTATILRQIGIWSS
jgi:hypothetical protein